MDPFLLVLAMCSTFMLQNTQGIIWGMKCGQEQSFYVPEGDCTISILGNER